MRATEVLLQTLTEAVLLESRLDFLRDKSRDALTARYQQDSDVPDNVAHQIEAKPGETPGDKLFAFLVDLDPDRAKKNLQWLIRIYLKGNFPLEDYYKAPEYLSQFAALKPQLAPDKRDINRYPGLADLYTAIAGLVPQVSQREVSRETDRKMHQQARVLLNTADYKIVVPLTQEASCYFGVNTQWCTAATGSRNYFDQYNREGPLYIILDKANNRRWQFQIESKSFMDENDRSINLRAFTEAHPDIADFFADMDRQQSPQAASLQGRPAILTNKALLFKTEYGLLGRIVGKVPLENKHVVGRVETRDLDLYAPDAHEDFCQILTDLGIHGNNGHLAAYDIFWNHNRYGRLTEVGDPVMQFHNDLQWVGVSFAGWHHYALMDQHQAVWAELGIEAGGTVWALTTDHRPGDIYPMVVQLLIQHPEAKRIVVSNNPVDDGMKNFRIEDLPDNLLRQVIDAKPEMGSISILYRLHGVTRLLKEKIVDTLETEGAPHEDWEGDLLVVARYDSLDDLIEDVGNDTAKWILELQSGDQDMDFYEYSADRHQRRDLIHSLDAELLAKLGTYLQENYPDEIEDEFEGEFDPTDVENVVSLAETVEDDGLRDACDQAVQESLRIGAENEAAEALHKAIKGNRYIFPTLHETGFVWDKQAVIKVPAAEVVDLIENENIPGGAVADWLAQLDGKLAVSEPYSGWSGSDDSAGNDFFAERIHELV